MKIIKKTITILFSIVLLLILSFNIFNFVSINILGNKLPTINGYAILEVVSGSMKPKFNIGDIIIIDTKVENYKVNDIVTFEDVNGSFVTHRILEIKDEEIITKGDANNTIDSPIKYESIVGKYSTKIKGVGALVKSIRTPFAMIMTLIIGVLLCVLISTDSKGNVILTEEEKEYLEFLELKKKKELEKKTEPKKKENTKKKVEPKKEPTANKQTKSKKESTTKKNTESNKKVTTKKKVESKKKSTTKKKTTSKKITKK